MLQDRPGGVRGQRGVVFVCDGNTCRSPLAEAIARQLFGEEFSSFSSAGLDARDGDPAHAHAVAAAAARGLDLTRHRARGLAVRGADATVAWFIAMNRSQAARLRAGGLAAGGAALGILGAPGVDVAHGGALPACPEIADPWGGDAEEYRRTGDRIARLLEAWRPWLAGPDAAQGAEP